MIFTKQSYCYGEYLFCSAVMFYFTWSGFQFVASNSPREVGSNLRGCSHTAQLQFAVSDYILHMYYMYCEYDENGMKSHLVKLMKFPFAEMHQTNVEISYYIDLPNSTWLWNFLFFLYWNPLITSVQNWWYWRQLQATKGNSRYVVTCHMFPCTSWWADSLLTFVDFFFSCS